MKVKVNVINAFVESETGGNPAGVVLNADQLTDSEKLMVAQKISLSETAFVSQSNVADFKVDFFTPSRQIAHCGHATIATFNFLNQQGLITQNNTSKETIDGIRKIQIEQGSTYMEQSRPKYQSIEPSHKSVLDSLGLDEGDIIYQPMLVNTGNSFVIVGVTSLKKLEALTIDEEMIRIISEELDLIGFYVFTTETNKVDRDASTRMFAPRYGISEESATGMAAGPLACYLYKFLEQKKQHFLIEQGYSMKPASPSLINVKLDIKNMEICSLSAGGQAAMSASFEVDI